MKRYMFALLIVFAAASVVDAGTVAWDHSSSGFWNTAANWDTLIIPGRGDDVIVSAGSGTVTVTSNSNIKSLTVGGAQSLVLSASRVIINNYAAISSSSTVDVHMHANVNSGSSVAQYLMNLMTANSFSIFTVMEPPQPIYFASDSSSQTDKNFFSAFPESFLFMYGGSELQPFLLATGHSGTITLDELYPNGPATPPATQSDIDQLNAIAANPSAWESTFKDRATQAANSGLYVGFGELGPLHFSSKSGQPYINYQVDTPWMLWLSDLAASHNMFLDIHMEATDTTLSEFANLLAHNSNTKIIWDHAGWCNTGQATATVISGLMAAYPNLYVSLKMRNISNAACSPTYSNGTLKSDWLTLLTTYADRIMVGTDAKYWFDNSTLPDQLSGSYASLDNMLNQLPDDIPQKIRTGTAKTLFGI